MDAVVGAGGVRERLALARAVANASGGTKSMTNPLRSDGGADTDKLPSDAVWELVTNIGYSRHFIRFLAIAQLEREGVWPLNSTAVKERVKAMTGADREPNRQNVLRSMEAFEEIGAVKRVEIKKSGYHWSLTEHGRRLGRDTAIEWCESFGFDEAAAALRASDLNNDERNTESTDSTE